MTVQVVSNRHLMNSPWPVSERLRVVLWKLTWCLLCRWTPRPLYGWRTLILRLFGTRVSGRPLVAESAVIRAPWRLVLEDLACIGPNAEVYNLGNVYLGARSVLAQHAYLCGGSHDFASLERPLLVGDIRLNRESFVGARALILLGVTVEVGAVVGAGAVVSKNVPPWTVWAGNPARQIRERTPAEKGER